MPQKFESVPTHNYITDVGVQTIDPLCNDFSVENGSKFKSYCYSKIKIKLELMLLILAEIIPKNILHCVDVALL